jgi:hypothetical protein
LWAVAETVGGLDGYRTSGRPHLSPLIPKGWNWVACARVRWGSGRCTYVIDVEQKCIYGDMREASAEEPYRSIYAGTDVSAEATVTPIEVGAVVFEDEGGAVRAFICNLDDAVREVALEFRGSSVRRVLGAGELLAVTLQGTPLDREAFPTPPDAFANLEVGTR